MDRPQAERRNAGPLVRCDYFKFKLQLDVENAILVERSTREIMEAYKAAHDVAGGWKMGIARVVDKQTRVYYIEAWGELSQAMTMFDFDEWSAHVERVDVRQSVNWSDDGAEALYQYLKANGTGNRMIQQFNKPKRQKVGGRDGGGQGFAVGSHKSDYRASVYRRGGEDGVVEFQLSGKRLERALAGVWQSRDDGSEAALSNPWQAVMNGLHHGAWYEFRTMAGLNKSDVLGIIAGDTLPPVDYDQQQARIIEMVNQLPPDVRHNFAQQLRLDLAA